MSGTQTGAEMIAAERKRQIEVEGYTPEHDDGHPGEMALAAGCYSTPDEPIRMRRLTYAWPWNFASWKPAPEDRIRELVKAGALCLAENERIEREIDRLLRAKRAPIEEGQA